MQGPLKLFCSYASPDRSHLEKFLPYLRTLERGGVVHVWHDGLIAPGTSWCSDIDVALREAQAIVVLLSADYLSSQFCMDVELPRAIERSEAQEVVLVPVLIRPTPLPPGLAILERQIIPRGLKHVTGWADPDEAWTSVANEITRAIRQFSERPSASWKRGGKARLSIEFRAMSKEALCVFQGSAELGRSRDCDVPLLRAPADVGKLHARLTYRSRSGSFIIEDLDSQNGTYVDGRRVRSAPLRTGSSVRLGGSLAFTYMEYRFEGRLAAALIHYDGREERGRYVLAPALRVGVGTSSSDAVQIPIEGDGVCAGVLDATGDRPMLTVMRAEAPAMVDVSRGVELDLLARWLRVKVMP